jgi:iron-sulfur cluster protein
MSENLSTHSFPIGYIDAPGPGECEAANAVLIEGWALARSGISRIDIERKPRQGDTSEDLNERGLIVLGTATRIIGTRPDVAAACPGYPEIHRAGWGFELRRESICRNVSFRVSVHAIATNLEGQSADIGCREIVFCAPDVAPPYLFCRRPFDSIYIDASGNVMPYPDCRPPKPFGSLRVPQQSIESIWTGHDFMELRQRIIDRDPPPMCLTCAHFINRNVDNPGYFTSR